MPRFELNDADVVVIVGSSAGGGTTVHWTGATPRLRADNRITLSPRIPYSQSSPWRCARRSISDVRWLGVGCRPAPGRI
jgi:hypothetical protein